MSKKMMRRSLALGALMAFVITGSAMAEELPTDVKVNSGDYCVLTDTEIIDATNEVAVGNPTGTQYTGDVNIDIQDKSTLTITSSGSDGGDIHGVIANTNITGNGIVYLNMGKSFLQCCTNCNYGNDFYLGNLCNVGTSLLSVH